MARSIVEDYWGGVVQRLQAEVDVLNQLIGHQAEKGRENELSLLRLLQSLLPQNVGVGSGVIIDSSGRRSRQTDILLYDKATQPAVMAQTNQVIYPVEVVYAAIEVKTTLSPRELQECGVKKADQVRLTPAGGLPSPKFYVFGYYYSQSPASFGSTIEGLDAAVCPDVTCVVSPGLLAKAGDPAGPGLVALHHRNDDGGRISRSWQTFDQVPAGRVVREGVHQYPVTAAPGVRYVAGEPGRALLLFCETILSDIARRAGFAAPVLGHYLDDVAREVLALGGSTVTT